jgi:small subunit ribosomal protein S20
MPNIKSAKKRVKVTATKHESNIPVKGSMKTAVKKTRKEATVENLNVANKRIDKACNKGIITKNKAARLKSNLSKKVNESK